MKPARPDLAHSNDPLPRMPAWALSGRGETLEEAAFLSGAALAHLHVVLKQESVPLALLRERLTLGAAEACVSLSGRSERAKELRDEVHLLRRGETPGPGGAVFQQWREAASRPISVRGLAKTLSGFAAEDIAAWLDAGQGGPVGRASATLQAVLEADPRAEMAAFILADAALARALGWDRIVPLLAARLPGRALKESDDALRLACHKAVWTAARDATVMAAELARRAARMRAVAPKLRAKGAAKAVELFLTHDALSPSIALTDPALGIGMSDRAARRLCDRLVDLGAVVELTGRDSFRLYGV